MGCGASMPALPSVPGAKREGPKQQEEGGAGAFLKDLGAFIMNMMKQEERDGLIERLNNDPDPQNQVEKLVKMLLTILETVKSVAAPTHDVVEFVMGCLIMFLYQASMKDKTPEKAIEHKEVIDSGYNVDSKFADAVYELEKSEDPKADLSAKLAAGTTPVTVAVEDIVEFQNKSGLGKPAHAVIVDKARKYIVIAVRGTENWKDMITDAAGLPTDFLEGYAHKSVAEGAQWLVNERRDLIISLAKQYPGYSVRVCGHSLGGGVAGTVALLLHRDAAIVSAVYAGAAVPEKKKKGDYKITGVGFGCAAVLSKDLTEEVHPYFTSFINDADLVPRLSTANAADFIRAADKMVDVWTALKEDIGKLLKMERPDGWPEGFASVTKVAKIAKSLASDPAAALQELVNEKMEKLAEGAEAAEEAAEVDPKKLYAPGRLIFLEKPQDGAKAYRLYKGGITSSCDKLMLKGSMMKDHSMGGYLFIVANGEVPPPEASAAA